MLNRRFSHYMIREPDSGSRASIENPSTPLSEAGWTDGFETATGEPVSAQRALRYAPVWQAVSMISGDLAKLPFQPYDISGESREVDKLHPSYRIVRRKANRERTAFVAWRTFFVHCLLWNNGYLYINRDEFGNPIELINLLPDRTCQERIGGRLFYITEVQRPGEESPQIEYLLPWEVFHVPGLAIDPTEAPSLVQSARDSWSLGLAAEGYSASFFKNGNRIGGFLAIPPHFTDKAAQNLEEGFRKRTGREEWFRTVILRDGARFEKAQFSPEEVQMTELREDSVRDVARWFNLSPSRLGLSDSVSYNSKAEDNRSYLDTTLSPWMEATEAEAWDKLLTRQEQDAESHEFDYNTEDLLRMSPIDQAQVDQTYVAMRVRSRNDIRKRLGMKPIPGGDVFDATPGSPGPAHDSQAGGKPTPEETSEDSGEGEQRSRDRQRLVFSLTHHARHKSRKPRAFVEWIDGGLVQHRREATEILGQDDHISRFSESASRMLGEKTEAELEQAVEQLCRQFEEQEL